MNHGVDAVHSGRHHTWVADINLEHLPPRLLRQRRRCVVEGTDLVAAVEQRFHQIRAAEAGAAGDEDVAEFSVSEASPMRRA